ncbi:hypothetical protein HK098_001812 [Nowakowskiella sp. JEL0407]|nr:hypothetical protein HK098_001812 [Nowakowskiella sp. JEL0407]
MVNWAGITVAVKSMRVHLESENWKILESEVEILTRLRHENVILFYGVSTDSDNQLIVLEFADGGSLYSYLQDHPQTVNSPIVVTHLMYQISLGMSYLHNQNPPILHGDLKAANCLLKNIKWGIMESTVKLTDFGMSKFKSASTSTKTQGSVSGTLRWIAPERLEAGKLTEKVDVYAFSMTAYEILSVGKLPFELNSFDSLSDLAIMSAIYRKERPVRPPTTNPPIFLEEHWTLTQQCWSENPENRPSFSKISATLRNIGFFFEKTDNASTTNIFGGGLRNTPSPSPPTFTGSNAFTTSNDSGGTGSSLYQFSNMSGARSDPQLNNNFGIHMEGRTSSTNQVKSDANNYQFLPISKPDMNAGYIGIVNSQKFSPSSEEMLTITNQVRAEQQEQKPWFYKNRVLVILGIVLGVVFGTMKKDTDGIASQTSTTRSPSSIASPTVSKLPIGAVVQTFTGHGDGVLSVATLPGKPLRLFSCSYDRSILEWDLQSGVAIKNLTGHTGDIRTLATLPGSPPRLYSGGGDATVREWDLTTGQMLRTFAGHTGNVFSVNVMSSNPARLFSGSDDKTVREWSLTTGLMARNFSGPTDSINAVATLANPPRVYTSGYDGVIREWDATSGTLLRNFTGHTNVVWTLAVLPGSPPRLYSGSFDNSVREWDLTSGLPLRTYLGHTDYVLAIAVYTGTPPRLFSAGRDKIIREWNVGTGQLTRTFTGHTSYIEGLTVTQDSTPRLFSAGGDRVVKEWSI